MTKETILNIDMSVVAKYISEKYLISTSIDTEDTLYITLNTGRIIITYEEFTEFLNNNQDNYLESNWTWMDLIDVYVVYCFISALNKLTDSLYQSNNIILQ